MATLTHDPLRRHGEKERRREGRTGRCRREGGLFCDVKGEEIREGKRRRSR